MELGQKLKQARLEAGLSQRQLCGEEITRNMLSLIENGTARPSMDTLRYLAQRLGKSVSYFLEEQAVTSPNQDLMAQARMAFAAGSFTLAVEILEQYQQPDPVFDWEKGLLIALCCMELAEQAIAQGRLPYARQLLEQAGEAGEATAYYGPELERRRLLLFSRIMPVALPADDRELLVRAEQALAEKNELRAAQYLEAAEDQTDPQWNYLWGQVFMARERYADAATCFKAALSRYPRECAGFLERCCRELEDYKGAYFYACQLREIP